MNCMTNNRRESSVGHRRMPVRFLVPAACLAILLVMTGGAWAIELGAVTVRDSSGSSIGQVDDDGTIRNSSVSVLER